MRKNILLSIGAITTLGVAAAAVIKNNEKVAEVTRNVIAGAKDVTVKVVGSIADCLDDIIISIRNDDDEFDEDEFDYDDEFEDDGFDESLSDLKQTPEEKRQERLDDLKQTIQDELFGSSDKLFNDEELEKLNRLVLAVDYIFNYVALNNKITLEELEGLKCSDGLIMDLFDDSIKAQLRKLIFI